MVTLRLSRTGAKKRPFYHVVAKNARSPRDGGNLERLGYFNPIASGSDVRLELNMERVNYWLGVGAQTSNRVEALLKEFKQFGLRTGAQYKATKTPRKKKVSETEAAAE